MWLALAIILILLWVGGFLSFTSPHLPCTSCSSSRPWHWSFTCAAAAEWYSILAVVQQAENVVLLEPSRPLRKSSSMAKASPTILAAQLADQLYRCFHRSSGCQQVIHDEHILPWLDGVEVDFERVGSVLQVIGNARCFRG